MLSRVIRPQSHPQIWVGTHGLSLQALACLVEQPAYVHVHLWSSRLCTYMHRRPRGWGWRCVDCTEHGATCYIQEQGKDVDV